MPKTKTLDDRIKELDLVGQSSIADRLGVRVNTVHVWRRREVGFPAPYVIIEDRPLWIWADIEAWHEEHERKKEGR